MLRDRVSLRSLDYPGIYTTDQTGLELRSALPLLLECQD